MKKTIFFLLILTGFISCQKEDHNGDLGGFWKLLQIELTENDSLINKRTENRFWAIQLDLIEVNRAMGRFQHVGDSLFIQMITTKPGLEQFGLYNPENERFKVLHLNRDKMILQSGKAVLSFRKF